MEKLQLKKLKTLIYNFADLLLLEDHLVKKELQSFIGVVDAQLLKTVHLQLLDGKKEETTG